MATVYNEYVLCTEHEGNTEEENNGYVVFNEISTTTRNRVVVVREGLRVERVLSFSSRRPNWDSPTPSHAGECVPPWFRGEGAHSIAGE
jgi:hypothetical protein